MGAVGEVLSTQLTDGMKILTLLEEQEVVVDLSRDSVTINGATVTLPDVQTSNGVIHVINEVLVPPGVDVDAYLRTCTSSNEVVEEEEEIEDEDIALDIPGTAIANGSFETLVTALSAADLVEDLSSPNGPYTVFAPTDDAFAALPTELVDCLLNDTPTLTQILLFHVAVGEVLSTQLTDGMKILTLLEEQEVVVDSSRNSVTINGATV